MKQERRKNQDRRKILFFRTSETPSRWILAATLASALVYFAILAFYFERGNPVLFWLLIAGEIFHVWLAATYIHTIWPSDRMPKRDPAFAPPVDVFITVAGEPVDIVERTVRAAKAMDYPDFRIFILNDGLVANKPDWQEIETLAKRLKVGCITRTKPGGAKAGNINHALQKTDAPFVAVFDADHVPYPAFLAKTMGFFADPRMGFVQTPQFYKNRDENYVAGGAWEQQELFFGPICKGKNRSNAMFMCGTNMVVRRKALESAGGMSESITEDFLTSVFVHAKGWKSVYVPEVLAEGLAPEDFLSYCKQQFRWSRGSLEVVFRHNPFFKKGLTLSQRLEYLASASYHLSGGVVLLNALFPLVFFYTGLVPFKISTMALAAAFLPYIFLMVYVLQKSTNFAYTFRALAFSMGSFWIQLQALGAVLLGRKNAFNVTSKKQLTGNFLYLALPHITYCLFLVAGIGVALVREGLSASVINNMAWGLFNVAVFSPFIMAALPAGKKEPAAETPREIPEYKPYIQTAHAASRERDERFRGSGMNFITHHEHEDD